MFVPVTLAILAAIVFYALVPIAGAFVVRQQWRLFRKAVAAAAALPGLDSGSVSRSRVRLGRVRAMGEVDAISGLDELWIRCEGVTCAVDLKDAWVYLLVGRSGDDAVERRRWSDLRSITPGSRAFVAGEAEMRDGRIVVAQRDRSPTLVILHDGDDDGLVRRAIWAGRHENEYWNPATQVSLALGAATMSAIVPFALPGRMPALIGALTLTAAFSPLLPLLPPGVVGFFAYRRFWKRARYCRARRDMGRLDDPAGAETDLWRRRAGAATLASALAFAGSLAVNGWLIVAALRRLL